LRFRLQLILLIQLGSFFHQLPAADLNWNLGLSSWTGRGNQLDIPYDYTENYLTFNADLATWSARFELEYSQPPEYGYEFTGLRRFWLTYSGDRHTLEIGDIGAVFGRGLALNLYEDQSIDFDNIPRGLRLNSLLTENLELDLLAGMKNEYRFYSPSSNLREPDGLNDFRIAGLQLGYSGPSINTAPFLIISQIESDYLWHELDPDQNSLSTSVVTQTMRVVQLGLSQAIYQDVWDGFLELSLQQKGLDYPIVSQEIMTTPDQISIETLESTERLRGDAVYAQLNWYPEWFTAMFEYKRYSYGREAATEKRDPLKQATKPLPWQIGPTGIRQHDINLLGNVTHPVDYGDEVGFNLEIRKYFGFSWSATLNASIVSQLGELGDDGETGLFFPTTDIAYSPWQEVFTEVEYIGESLSNRMFLAYTRAVLSGSTAAEITSHVTFVPAYFSWHPSDILVLSTVLEFQASDLTAEAYETVDPPAESAGDHAYTSTHVIFSVDFQHRYSASLIWDTSDDAALVREDSDPGRQHWVSTEISVKPTDKIWLRASYGKEKGGVRCTGGVCRVLNPFEGFRVSLEWRF